MKATTLASFVQPTVEESFDKGWFWNLRLDLTVAITLKEKHGRTLAQALTRLDAIKTTSKSTSEPLIDMFMSHKQTGIPLMDRANVACKAVNLKKQHTLGEKKADEDLAALSKIRADASTHLGRKQDHWVASVVEAIGQCRDNMSKVGSEKAAELATEIGKEIFQLFEESAKMWLKCAGGFLKLAQTEEDLKEESEGRPFRVQTYKNILQELAGQYKLLVHDFQNDLSQSGKTSIIPSSKLNVCWKHFHDAVPNFEVVFSKLEDVTPMTPYPINDAGMDGYKEALITACKGPCAEWVRINLAEMSAAFERQKKLLEGVPKAQQETFLGSLPERVKRFYCSGSRMIAHPGDVVNDVAAEVKNACIPGTLVEITTMLFNPDVPPPDFSPDTISNVATWADFVVDDVVAKQDTLNNFAVGINPSASRDVEKAVQFCRLKQELASAVSEVMIPGARIDESTLKTVTDKLEVAFQTFEKIRYSRDLTLNDADCTQLKAIPDAAMIQFARNVIFPLYRQRLSEALHHIPSEDEQVKFHSKTLNVKTKAWAFKHERAILAPQIAADLASFHFQFIKTLPFRHMNTDLVTELDVEVVRLKKALEWKCSVEAMNIILNHFKENTTVEDKQSIVDEFRPVVPAPKSNHRNK